MRAKLCERVSEVLLNAGGSNGKKFDSGVGWGFCLFVAIYMGFKLLLKKPLAIYVSVLVFLLFC